MKNIRQCLTFFFITILLSSCQTHFSSSSNNVVLTDDQDVINLDERLDDGRHSQKVDNLLFLVDDSPELLKYDGGILQRNLLFALLTKMQRTIPNIKLKQGVRIFGPHANPINFDNTLLYGMAQGEDSQIKPLLLNNTSKYTMFNSVSMALDAEYHELKYVSGNTAIIVLSAFKGPDSDSLLESVALIHDFYRERVSIYPIVVALKKDQDKNIDYMSRVAVNGFSRQVKELQGSDNLADFMEDVLFRISSPPPILSTTQKEAPRSATIVKNSPLSHEKLIKEKELRVQLKTQFDFNKAAIMPRYKDKLQKVAEFMIKYPETTTVIEGHTCSMGTAKYNLKLSEKRAQAVKDYLIREGVGAGRLDIMAYGETKPIASNATNKGREQNRRVIAVIKTMVQK